MAKSKAQLQRECRARKRRSEQLEDILSTSPLERAQRVQVLHHKFMMTACDPDGTVLDLVRLHEALCMEESVPINYSLMDRGDDLD